MNLIYIYLLLFAKIILHFIFYNFVDMQIFLKNVRAFRETRANVLISLKIYSTNFQGTLETLANPLDDNVTTSFPITPIYRANQDV